MNDQIHFTIFIPTRERKDTLIHTVSSALSQDYDNYTVLVSDNASEDGTERLLASIQDPRLKYINTRKRVSMSHNWEFGLNQINNGWITILGDDDAILPGTLSRVEKIIRKTGTQAVRSNGCSFRWPCLDKLKYGSLSVSTKKGYKIVSSEKALRSVLNGEMAYTDLPVLYNGGFVDFALLKQAKERAGDFIKSINPDLYLGIVLAFLTTDYVYSYEPLAINGASKHSGGTAFFENTKSKRAYDPVQKFFSEGNLPLHSDVPTMPDGLPVRSAQALVFEAFLQASSFHSLKNIEISYKDMLSVILKRESIFPGEVQVFSKLFAEQHSLNLESIKHDIKSGWGSQFKRSAKFCFKWPMKQINKLNSLWSNNIGIQGNPSLPLANVYEASIVAGTLKQLPVEGPIWQLKYIMRNRRKSNH